MTISRSLDQHRRHSNPRITAVALKVLIVCFEPSGTQDSVVSLLLLSPICSTCFHDPGDQQQPSMIVNSCLPTVLSIPQCQFGLHLKPDHNMQVYNWWSALSRPIQIDESLVAYVPIPGISSPSISIDRGEGKTGELLVCPKIAKHCTT